jgi:pilus assembly protein CpaB
VSLRSILVVLLAIVSGGSAAVGINTLRNQGAEVDKGEMVSVVMAAADIPRGRFVKEDMLTTKDYPKAMVPSGAITNKEEAIDRTVFMPLLAGEPILEAKLASKKAGRGLAPLIPSGMRACTIQASLASGVAGLILPGNRVDVLLSMTNAGNANDTTGGGSTTTLLQNAEILAVDQQMDAPADAKADAKLQSVTLLVTPDQAARLELGQEKGRLHLTLRNPNDDKEAATKPATLTGMLGSEKPLEERLKGWLDIYGKWRETQKALQVSQPVQAAEVIPAGPPPSTIRTIRGVSEGIVLVEQNEAPTKKR